MFKSLFAQLVNKNGTPVEVTDDNRLKVDSSISATGVTRVPNIIRATGAGTIAPVVYAFSVSNVGVADGTILGATIKPGETLNFSPELNNYYAANSITYDGTGTELVIIYNS